MNEIIQGDCLEEMRKMADNSISAIVTDPPYGLSFMGKGWDNAVPGSDYWKACYRIIKPGAFLLAMGGTRTAHRLASAIEESGFDIRDTIMWIYGSGFPKSHNNFGIEGYGTALKPAYEPIIMAMKPLDGTFKQNAEKWGQAGINIDDCRIGNDDTRAPTYNMTSKGHKGGAYGSKDVDYSRNGQIAGSSKGRWPANVILDEEAGKMLDEQSGHSKSPHGIVKGQSRSSGIMGTPSGHHFQQGYADTGGASRFFKSIEKDCFLCHNPCSKAWLKECKNSHALNANHNLKITQVTNQNIAQENVNLTPEEQFAQNVKFAGNLCDLCAMNIAQGLVAIRISDSNKEALRATLDYIGSFKSSILIQNLVSFAELWENIDTIPTIGSLSILFGSVQHAIENYTKPENLNQNGRNEQSRFLYCAKASSRERNEGLEGLPDTMMEVDRKGRNQAGFNSEDRSPMLPRKNSHPTVKPLKLMEYLIRLVMPPKDGILLDPFAGSGTTILAAKRLGFNAIGIEKQKEYCEIARSRIASYVPKTREPDLFDLASDN